MNETLLRRRAAMMCKSGSILPDGYTQKEWLVSNKSYISLGLSLNYMTIETTLKWVDFSTSYAMMGSTNCFFGYNQGATLWRTNGMGTAGGYSEFAAPNTTDTYTIFYSRARTLVTFQINGVTATRTVSAVSAATLYLFNIANNNSYRMNAKLGVTKIYDGSGNLVSHLIPCVNANNQSGMYDVIRNTFYTTTSFTTE